MEWVTTTAKTLPEAIDLALDNLGVDESEAEIVVLEEPTKGLFGRVRGTARVEARVKPKAIRPKTERGRNRRGRGGDRSRGDRNKRARSNDRGGRSNNGNNAGEGGRSGGQKRRRGSKGGQGSGGKATATSDGSTSNASKSEASESTAGKSNRDRDRAVESTSATASDRSGSGSDSGSSGRSSRRRRRSRGSGSNSGNGGSNANKGHERDSRAEKNEANVKTADNNKQETPVEEVEEHLRSFLGGLTEAFGLEGDVAIDTSETDVMVATVEGQHGLMVGPKGRTLDAIQELARVSSQRAAPSNIRIRVDVGGYRKQRAAALGQFARNAADKAVDNGCEVALEPMSPADRKSVHDALVEDDRVETRSVGTEPRRKVVVIPVASTGSNADGEEE